MATVSLMGRTMAKSKKPHKTGSKQSSNEQEPAREPSAGVVSVPAYASDITESGVQSKVQKVLQNALPASSSRASGVHQVILESEHDLQIQPIASSSPVAQNEVSVFKPIEVSSPITPIEQEETDTGAQRALKRWTPPPKKVLPPEPEPAPALPPPPEQTDVGPKPADEFAGPSTVSSAFQYEIDRYSPSFRVPTRPAPRMTIGQEFDIPKLVAHTTEIALGVQNQHSDSDDLSSAMMYFAGHAGKSTYTAELRFRAHCATERANELDSSINSVQPLPQEEEQWLQLDSFAPPQEETPRILPSSGLSMLDVIDQSYKTILTGPESFAPPRQVEVEVDYSQAQSRLHPPQSGLSGGLGSTKAGGNSFKNRWSKK